MFPRLSLLFYVKLESSDAFYRRLCECICEQVARTVSFRGDNAYIELDPVNIETKYSMSMRVKSTANDGLIFYTSDDRPAQVGIATRGSTDPQKPLEFDNFIEYRPFSE